MSDVIRTTGLVKRYGRQNALDGLDLAVGAGDIHGFLGPNGAGKSTTIRILLGLARASGGTAAVFGRDPWRDAVALHRRLAYVPGDVNVWPNLSGGESIQIDAAGSRTPLVVEAVPGGAVMAGRQGLAVVQSAYTASQHVVYNEMRRHCPLQVEGDDGVGVERIGPVAAQPKRLGHACGPLDHRCLERIDIEEGRGLGTPVDRVLVGEPGFVAAAVPDTGEYPGAAVQFNRAGVHDRARGDGKECR